MFTMVGFRHQQLDVLPEDLGGGVAEKPLGRRVERLDPAMLVDGDDSIDHMVHDGAHPLLGLNRFLHPLLQLLLQPLAVGGVHAVYLTSWWCMKAPCPSERP